MTGPFTDLTALAAHLRGLAAAHEPITFDQTILAAPEAGALATAFALPDQQFLTVTGVASGDIGDPTGNVLTVGTGTAAVLRVADVPIALSLWIADGALQLSVTATMPDGWTFTDSFTGLALFPFDVSTVSGARFVYGTVEQSAFTWPGEDGTSVDLAPGQNLLCRIGLGGVAGLAGLLGQVIGDDMSLRCFGPFAPTTGQLLPVGMLTAPIGGSGFSIGAAPYGLSLTDPRVAVRIGTADDDTAPLQDVDLLVLGTFQQVLQVSVSIPMAGAVYRVSTTPLPASHSITALVESLPGGAGFTDYIPAELTSVFSSVGLDNFAMTVTTTPGVGYFGLSLSTLQPWPLIDDVLVLDGLNLVIETVDPSGLDWTSARIAARARFLPDIFTGEFDFTVGLEKQTSWEVSSVSGSYYGSVDLGDLVAGLLGSQDSVPEALRGISFSDFGIDATRSAPGKPFDYTCYGSAQVSLPVLDTQLTAHLTVVFSKAATGYSVQLVGALAIGEEAFALHLDLGAAGSLLSATWTSTGSPLEFGDIAAAFGWTDMPTLPGNLDLALTGAGFSYDFTAGNLVLTARSQNYGQLVFAASTVDSQPAYLMDLTVPLNVKLSDLPVAGPQIPPSVDVGIAQVEVAYASADHSAGAVTALDTTLTALGGQPLGYASLDAGMVLVANLRLGGDTQSLRLPFGTPDDQQQLPAAKVITPEGLPVADPGPGSGPPAPVDPTPQPPPPPTQGSGTWLDVGKTFGPLQLQRVGMEYANGTLIFALDADIAFGPLGLSLDGLGVGSPLDAFAPVFTLTGLGLSYSTPPLQVLGAMLRVPQSSLAPGVELQFDGELVVKAEDFTIGALGSYAQSSTGLPSLFVFAQLEAPLGGPPAFFVTGLMGGFGFNRSLAVPGQDEVAGFPLLALATTPPPGTGTGTPQDPSQILHVLEGDAPLNGVTKAWITPKAGEFWLAAGVEFTSFELVSTKALLVAEFGQELNIALLGTSTLQLPLPEAGSQACAYVEMMIRVVVQPAQGYVSATAILSDNSYVLTPDCHLTGGFAFCLWFGDNPDAGQFVVTLGGYHPAFQIPGNFPKVPRLGFNWPVSDVVSIKGNAYFALTGSCAMAGGGLEVLFHDGDLQAWFTAQADFLVSWHPFSYAAEISVSIGVSYRLNLLFCHKTISLSLGADLSLWGPPTSGVVRVDLVVVSFSVRFGSDGSAAAASEPLSWSDFSALLPAAADVCSISITDGLFKTQDAPENSSGKLWIVRSKQLAFQTRSAMPASELAYAGRTVQSSGTAPDGIAIKPMNLSGVASTHSLSIYQGSSATPVDTSGWTLEPLPQTMPASLWSAPPVPFSQVPAAPSADVLPGELCGFSVTAPTPRPGNSRGPLPVQLLMADYLSPAGQAPLSAAVTLSTDYLPTPSEQTVGLLRQVSTGAAQQGRSALFGVLAGAVMPDGSALFVGVDGDLAVLAAGAGHLFSDSPAQQN
ncbi:DUF6603 domain-containing protein [Streptacidiphilus anmyonensis]|uniref:DUF6603 domain-containing protein n=1 Tax=Streptacidiphilus anmyonensis TaxID=405782 RepID=UPI0006942AAB|nr:DUF6603 domain-containing protein [Streptacidiphilus anmyonensis]